jgi:hypothetical protein
MRDTMSAGGVWVLDSARRVARWHKGLPLVFRRKHVRLHGPSGRNPGGPLRHGGETIPPDGAALHNVPYAPYMPYTTFNDLLMTSRPTTEQDANAHPHGCAILRCVPG